MARNANKLANAGRRCRDCKHPTKNHRYGDSEAQRAEGREGKTCGCGCKIGQ